MSSTRRLPTLLLLACCAYLFAVGARSHLVAPLVSAELLGMSVQAEDTDTDDDAMGACTAVHFGQNLDNGVLEDRSIAPSLPHDPIVASYLPRVASARPRLAVRELFRPPRTASF